MKTKLVVILWISLLIFVCENGERVIAQNTSVPQDEIVSNQSEVKIETLNLLDKVRNRAVPVVLYSSVNKGNLSADKKDNKKQKLKPAIISHGYGGKNTEYSFIANNLVAHGYFVASVQHELPSDEPLPKIGNPYQTRKPNWERGVQNILFVVRELKRIKPNLDFNKLLLVGHSNGGDISMLFATEHPKLVRQVISLDNRRMPIPRTKKPQILSLRSNDQTADVGVLPTFEEQTKFGIKIVKLNAIIHDDMWDGATEKQKHEINRVISSFIYLD